MHFLQQWRRACMLHLQKSATVEVTPWFTAAVMISLLKHPSYHFTMLISAFWYPSYDSECQGVPFFLHVGIQQHTFASSALPCQTPFCHAAPPLSAVAATLSRQQHVMGYWWEGSVSSAISPTSTCNVVVLRYKRRRINFKAALIFSNTRGMLTLISLMELGWDLWKLE